MFIQTRLRISQLYLFYHQKFTIFTIKGVLQREKDRACARFLDQWHHRLSSEERVMTVTIRNDKMTEINYLMFLY